jgi:DNA-binding HxlR family transcriptional regulator
VQLIFSRKLKKSTVADGRCRTRIITEGVIPSLHVYYKDTHSKQYLKAANTGASLRTGLRTETTINNTYDFAIGRRLRNLPALRQLGFEANHRILEVEKLSHDCGIGQQSFERLQHPANIEGQRASALRFGDPRVQALFAVLVLFSLQPQGFRNKELRPLVAQALGLDSRDITQGKMSYDLRRLRLHGLIERIPGTHRYSLTTLGLRTALFCSRIFTRAIRPGLSQIADPNLPQDSSKLTAAFHHLEAQLTNYLIDKKAA